MPRCVDATTAGAEEVPEENKQVAGRKLQRCQTVQREIFAPKTNGPQRSSMVKVSPGLRPSGMVTERSMPSARKGRSSPAAKPTGTVRSWRRSVESVGACFRRCFGFFGVGSFFGSRSFFSTGGGGGGGGVDGGAGVGTFSSSRTSSAAVSSSRGGGVGVVSAVVGAATWLSSESMRDCRASTRARRSSSASPSFSTLSTRAAPLLRALRKSSPKYFCVADGLGAGAAGGGSFFFAAASSARRASLAVSSSRSLAASPRARSAESR
mmetsp:Transcript_29480/g.90207  ORF Transcript_29480/g.90207 Transcript_29480/m.90207 type:complete len:266 (+) Transcript_29480:1218-2015(+)